MQPWAAGADGFGWAKPPVLANYTRMLLTHESHRTRWLGLIAAWLVLGVLIFWDANAFRGSIQLLDSLGLRGAAAPSTPLKRTCPTMYADAQMWVRHALALADGAGPQLRYTYVDNAPFGREVHWDSGFAWLIVGAGKLQQWLYGGAFSAAVEQSMAWIDAVLLLAFIVGLSGWTARRAGLGAGALLGFAMLGNPDFFSGFAPNYIDHHGLLAAAVLGLFLGGIFMGIGFWRQPESASELLPTSHRAARTAAIASAAWGAFGMWISAATLIPAIAIMGIAGTLAMVVFGGQAPKRGIVLDPDLWRTWGRVGGVLCLLFYLLEYAPAHLGFRMEVNHPAYALGWWGGSEVIAQIAEWRRDRHWPAAKVQWLLAAGIAICVAPLIIAIGGERVFVVFDPFVTRLSQHVAEGISFMTQARIFGPGRVWQELPWIGTTIALGVLLLWRARPADRSVVAFCVLAFAASLAMALRQVRWWPSVSGPEFCLMLLAAIELSAGRRRWVGWAWAAAGVLLMGWPAVARVTAQQSLNQRRVVDANDAFQPFYRDVAAALRASQPKGDIVLLSSPNSSVAIGYYGLFKTIGTLYWENLDGTKAAAEMFSAQSESEARRLIRARGVTHVAMITHENFLVEYFGLLHPDGTQQEFQNSFGYKLLIQHQVPIWLEPIPYEYPKEIPAKIGDVGLYKTVFGDPRAETQYEAALQDFDANRITAGEAKLDAALALAPRSAEFWLVKGHARLAQHDPVGALKATQKAIDFCPPPRRVGVCQSEANRCFQLHAYADAAALYRQALSMQFDLTMANNLVWVLATSPDPAVRNGPEALKLAEQLVSKQQDPTLLSGYAAALAECGRYRDAVVVQSRGLELAKQANSAPQIAAAEARLKKYHAGQPWRD